MTNRVKKYELYGLYCPITGDLMYVGITTVGLQRRFNGHLKKPTNHLMENWIIGLQLINKINQYLSDGLNLVQIGKIYGCSNKIIHKFIQKKDESK